MAKKKERITINGETFIIENATVSKRLGYGCFQSLDSCYERPSYAKRGIYDYWEKWFMELGANMAECGIGSYNSMQFTYHGYFTYEGVEYYAYITRCYNRLYRVV